MRLISGPIGTLVEIALLAWVAGCSGGNPPAGPASTAGSGPHEETTGGVGGTGGRVTGGSGGMAAAPDASSGPMPDAAGATPDTAVAVTPDAGTAVVADAGAMGLVDSNTPMGSDGGAQPSYEGEIPIYYGPEVGPIVKMNCPGDPTDGWTEYRDSFHIERPYNVPINTRFSIVGGIYHFWVFPNDRPHSTIAKGRNPRTEATYGGTEDKANVPGGGGLHGTIGFFRTGQRMYSADMFIEKSAVGSAIMQIHTTAQGGGPIGLRIQSNGNMVNNGSLTVVNGSQVPGGLVDTWFNFKASLNTANTEVQIFINNCLMKTYTGTRGDGNFYFKNGVYFCDAGSGCRTHFKNVHLYKK